jgi:hypothetical protein
MRIGFGRSDVTPRVGVELSGFGAFINRHSTGVRDRLWARAMAFDQDGARLVLVSCDLIGLPGAVVHQVRQLVGAASGLPLEAVMVHCTHTHSGPGTAAYIGWGEADVPYMEILPRRIAHACTNALEGLQEARLSLAEVPCEGMSYNREAEKMPADLSAALRDDWRPARPDLTETTCHVVKAEAGGRLIGFFSCFGCHPVVCCEQTRQIHGDFAGVATNLLEGEHPGSVGLFLQGAQGDLNSCVAHRPEPESLRALDVIAARYARQVRAGLAACRPVQVDSIRCAVRRHAFSRKPWDLATLRAKLAASEAVLHAPGASDESYELRLAAVHASALRLLIAAREAGQSLEPAAELQGFRIGPIALLGAPFEVFRAIKQDVVARAKSPIPLVLGITNDDLGYAVDRAAAARGGYAADLVPLICRALPFANIHDELVGELLALDAALA